MRIKCGHVYLTLVLCLLSASVFAVIGGTNSSLLSVISDGET